MYGTAYQLIATERHVHAASSQLRGSEVPLDVSNGTCKIKRTEVDTLLARARHLAQQPDALPAPPR